MRTHSCDKPLSWATEDDSINNKGFRCPHFSVESKCKRFSLMATGTVTAKCAKILCIKVLLNLLHHQSGSPHKWIDDSPSSLRILTSRKSQFSKGPFGGVPIRGRHFRNLI